MTTRMMNLVVKAIEAAGIKAELTTVQKNNETLTGVTFGDLTVRPTLYFTEEYDGMTSKQIAEKLIEKYESLPKAPEVDIDAIMNKDYIRENVKMKLVPESPYIEDKAKKQFLDLYELFYIPTQVPNGYITLTENHLFRLGISVHELERWAKNSYEVKGMYETLMEMNPQMAELLPKPEHEEQLVLSNTEKLYGATAITSKAVLDHACDRLGAETIYILPSSIHECLALAMGEPDELRNMVCEVNDTQVVPQERLSYNVYKYTLGGELEIA